jgi:predicted nucleotidyltransferase
MIKHHKLPAHIQDLIPEAIAYLGSRSDIQFAYLFGSFGRGKPLSLSDVDIAVYFTHITDIQDRRMEILGALTHLLQTDEVDLVILNRAPLTLRMKVLEHKKIVVDHEPFLRHQYESLTLREYFDFSIRERAILERRFLHG